MSYRYTIEVRHTGLGKFRVITGTDKYVVESKAEAQRQGWDAMYQKKKAADDVRDERARAKAAQEDNKAEAQHRTEEAKAALESVNSLLISYLQHTAVARWEDLLEKKPFSSPQPAEPTYPKFPNEPLEVEFPADLALIDKLIPSKRAQKEQKARELYERSHAYWQKQVQQIEEQNKQRYDVYLAAFENWQKSKADYERRTEEHNASVLKRKEDYISGAPEATCDLCELVLSRSKYPDAFPQDFQLDYNADTKILLVDYSLPKPDDLPRVKEVKYVKDRGDFTEVFLSDSEAHKQYDDTIYQICLRSLHELFIAEDRGYLEAIVFNGWVTDVDRATGKETTACIVTVQAKKKEFLEINLRQVDPKTCFKALKGIGSSKLHSITPVAPILKMDREDKRFISSYEVADELDESFNLAAMDWEDFEHLIREMFAKEFTQAGGEVKVTRASRDGGVDAVAFDPDPIRGGKIVIQAKRYTNTVDVSAVRDLYGTVVNEGATKGVLVTTSDYGPDAYAFASGKPLTLLNGGNLLHLLEKHGHKAKIDLKAAKALLASQKVDK